MKIPKCSFIKVKINLIKIGSPDKNNKAFIHNLSLNLKKELSKIPKYSFTKVKI